MMGRASIIRSVALVALVASLSVGVEAADTSVAFAATLDPFIAKYCTDCHGAKKQKGDVRLDTLSPNLTDPKVAIAWRDVIDAMRKGEMPPEDKPRPALAEINKIIETIDAEMYPYIREPPASEVSRKKDENRFKKDVGYW